MLLGIVNTESCHSHYFVPIFTDKSQKNKKRKKNHAPLIDALFFEKEVVDWFSL